MTYTAEEVRKCAQHIDPNNSVGYVGMNADARNMLTAYAADLDRRADGVTDAVRVAGAMLANCAFNLAQCDRLTTRERQSLDASRKVWDAAIAALPVAAEPTQPAHDPDCNVHMADVKRRMAGCDCSRSHPAPSAQPANSVQVTDEMVRTAERLRNGLHAAACRMPDGWADVAADWARDAQALFDALAAQGQGDRYTPLSIPDDAPDSYAQAYIRDWCSDHVKAYVARITASPAGVPDVRAMVDRFLGWRLPDDFAPDCGISFDGREDDEWNKNKTWPIGTNLLTAAQAEQMFRYVLGDGQPRAVPDGWVLVPREPTPEMQQRGAYVVSGVTPVGAAATWKAMLAAAPSAKPAEPVAQACAVTAKDVVAALQRDIAEHGVAEIRAAELAILVAPSLVDQPSAVPDGASLIAAERRRQKDVEGWTPKHDAEHGGGEMAVAAACYATPAGYMLRDHTPPLMWPWDESWWKPGDRLRELVKAGALIAAEIDRLAAATSQGEPANG